MSLHCSERWLTVLFIKPPRGNLVNEGGSRYFDNRNIYDLKRKFCKVVSFFFFNEERIEKRMKGDGPAWSSNWDLSVWGLHVVIVYRWVFSRYFGFLPLFKNMVGRLIGNSKLPLHGWMDEKCKHWIQWPCKCLAGSSIELNPNLEYYISMLRNSHLVVRYLFGHSFYPCMFQIFNCFAFI